MQCLSLLSSSEKNSSESLTIALIWVSLEICCSYSLGLPLRVSLSSNTFPPFIKRQLLAPIFSSKFSTSLRLLQQLSINNLSNLELACIVLWNIYKWLLMKVSRKNCLVPEIMMMASWMRSAISIIITIRNSTHDDSNYDQNQPKHY